MITIIISTGNTELDERLGGGIPFPSLVLIEGGHGTGKTLMAQQIVWGGLRAGKRVVVCTTEDTCHGYLARMNELGMSAEDYFITGQLKIFSAQMKGVKWSKHEAELLPFALKVFINLKKKEYDIFVLDSASVILKYSSPSIILGLFTEAKVLTDEKKVIIFTLHPGILDEELFTQLRALADVYFKLEEQQIGGQVLKILKVVKMRGVLECPRPMIAFQVYPSLGITVVPLALVKT